MLYPCLCLLPAPSPPPVAHRPQCLCSLQGRIRPEDFLRLLARRVDICDDRLTSFLQLVHAALQPRVPYSAVRPPFTIVLVANTKRRNEVYAQLQRRADFARMCGNAGVLGQHVRKFKTAVKFFGYACTIRPWLSTDVAFVL